MTQYVNAREWLQQAGIECSSVVAEDLQLSDIVADSRAVSPGAVFCAYPGIRVDGREYMAAAQQQGALLILYEAADFSPAPDITVPAIPVTNLQFRVGELADLFFSKPSQQLQVFGVTGTNGKTTSCYLLAQAFTEMGLEAAIMGTIGNGPLNALQSASHTTGDAISVHRQLAQFAAQGVTQVCIEVSSHALHQGRVAGVQFYATLFTNLSHDHLDYHGDLEAYAAAKKLLFTEFPAQLTISNMDDQTGAELADIAIAEFFAGFGAGGSVQAEDVQASRTGLSFHVEGSGVDFPVNTPLIGLVNVPNVLMLVTTLLALSAEVEQIQSICTKLHAAPGRMELFSAPGFAQIVVDYAHTPDALEKALLSVREHCAGKLWCVVGCGGDRDRTKRPEMGRIAAQHADYLIVTNDNPRSENPEQIAADIVAELNAPYEIVLDRAEAIRAAVQGADEADWVLVAGKGHEATQTIGEQVLPFSDRQQVQQAMEVAA